MADAIRQLSRFVAAVAFPIVAAVLPVRELLLFESECFAHEQPQTQTINKG